MPRYQITGPDGHTYEVTAPDGASEADVLAHVKAEAAKNPKAASLPPLTTGERKAYAEALPGEPKGAKTRKAIEDKHGGAAATSKEVEPVSDFLGRYVAPPLVAGGLAAGVPALAASATAPWIPATMLPARMAAGVSPAAVEPTMAEIAALVTGAGSKVAGGAQAVADNPAVKEALKWIARGALGTAGFEGARRMMK